MPRSSSKSKGRRRPPSNKLETPDMDDNASDVTQMSIDEDDDNKSGTIDTVQTDTVVSTVDLTEEKLKEALENATHKNVSIRVEALKILQSIFSSHFVPGLLDNWKVTAADAVEKCMRKKTGDECRRALQLGVLLALQLGYDFGPSVSRYQPILRDWVADWTINSDFRVDCSNALSLYTYLTVEEIEEISGALNLFHEIWTRAKNSSPADFGPLYCSSLNAWILMLLRLPNRYLETALTKDLPILSENLENPQMEIRIGSGEALCVLYELANELPAYAEESFRPAQMAHTLSLLEAMSRDSVKYQAKKDRRQQRASFRDIHAALKNEEGPDIKVQFGTETMVLDSWSSKLCYDAICSFLRGGINCHLQENLILRNIFGLGAPILNPAGGKLSKLERQVLNQSVTKARSLLRGKQRDKRTATFS